MARLEIAKLYYMLSSSNDKQYEIEKDKSA